MNKILLFVHQTILLLVATSKLFEPSVEKMKWNYEWYFTMFHNPIQRERQTLS